MYSFNHLLLFFIVFVGPFYAQLFLCVVSLFVSLILLSAVFFICVRVRHKCGTKLESYEQLFMHRHANCECTTK